MWIAKIGFESHAILEGLITMYAFNVDKGDKGWGKFSTKIHLKIVCTVISFTSQEVTVDCACPILSVYS